MPYERWLDFAIRVGSLKSTVTYLRGLVDEIRGVQGFCHLGVCILVEFSDSVPRISVMRLLRNQELVVAEQACIICYCMSCGELPPACASPLPFSPVETLVVTFSYFMTTAKEKVVAALTFQSGRPFHQSEAYPKCATSLRQAILLPTVGSMMHRRVGSMWNVDC